MGQWLNSLTHGRSGCDHWPQGDLDVLCCCITYPGSACVTSRNSKSTAPLTWLANRYWRFPHKSFGNQFCVVKVTGQKVAFNISHRKNIIMYPELFVLRPQTNYSTIKNSRSFVLGNNIIWPQEYCYITSNWDKSIHICCLPLSLESTEITSCTRIRQSWFLKIIF